MAKEDKKFKKAESKINKLLSEYKIRLVAATNNYSQILIDFAREYNTVWKEYYKEDS